MADVYKRQDIWYASLNDMYNMVVIMDKNARVYIDQNKHTLTYQLSDSDYHFDYGRGRIVYTVSYTHLDVYKRQIHD